MKPASRTFAAVLLAFCWTLVVIRCSHAEGFSASRRRCVDEKCATIISLGRAVVNYNANKKGMVSFKINSLMRVMAKGAGPDGSLWGVEVNGRQGFAPKNFIKETKIFYGDSQLKYVGEEPVHEEGSTTIIQAQTQPPSVLSQPDTTSTITSTTAPHNATIEDQRVEVNAEEATNDQHTTSTNEDKPQKPEVMIGVPTPSPIGEEVVQRSIVANLSPEITGKDEGEIEEDEHRREIDIDDSGEEEDEEEGDEDEEADSDDDYNTIANNTYNEMIEKPSKLLNEAPANDVPLTNVNQTPATADSPATNSLYDNINLLHSGEVFMGVDKNGNDNLELPAVAQIESGQNTMLEGLSGLKPALQTKEQLSVQKIPDTHNDYSAKNVLENELVLDDGNQTAGETQQQTDGPPLEKPELVLINVTDPDETRDIFSDNHQLYAEGGDIAQIPPNDAQDESKKSSDLLPLEVNNSDLMTENTLNSLPNTVEGLGVSSSNMNLHSEEIATKIEPTTVMYDTFVGTNLPYNSMEQFGLEPLSLEHLASASQSSQELPKMSVSNTESTSDFPDVLPPILDSADNVVGTDSTHHIVTNFVEKDLISDVADSGSNVPEAENTNRVDVDNIPTIEVPVLNNLVKPTSDELREKGLFETITNVVKNMITSDRKAGDDLVAQERSEQKDIIEELGYDSISNKEMTDDSQQYCEKLSSNECPRMFNQPNIEKTDFSSHYQFIKNGIEHSDFLQIIMAKVVEMSELLACLAIAALTSLFFLFGYYCFCNSSREGLLLAKLNQLEGSLLAMQKENDILNYNLLSTRQKLSSIEDNSFGSDDMVISLRREMEEELVEKALLQEQISSLQKELEAAADAGIELNRIVSELLSSQNGDETIISRVEDLQKQLNEQENTILEINACLADKSRENNELQLMLVEQKSNYESSVQNLQRENDDLETEKENLCARLNDMKTEYEGNITTALENKNLEITRLQNEIVETNSKLANEHRKWQTSVAKVEALEECLKSIKRDPGVNIGEVINVANVKAELLDVQKSFNSLNERYNQELEARQIASDHLKVSVAELERLKQDYNQSEKDKLEAQTRLEVLSNYFREKETQLQKELNLKEALWLKQQGETTTTVDRVTALQEDIQSLKSQNEALRAEMEAQIAAHKAQTGTLENRAHETWLAARQADRRCEEARAEAAALRRKLTALAGGNTSDVNREEIAAAPSPIHMEPPASPLIGHMQPPPPPFMPPPPPPFMGPPPPFLSMPPPPPPPLSAAFMSSGEMRPAPLGRIMSPPPQRRFSPQHSDYDDYEDDNSLPRRAYSPSIRTYRSLSPTDSRYSYGGRRQSHDYASRYDDDTEADFLQPPSPTNMRRERKNSGLLMMKNDDDDDHSEDNHYRSHKSNSNRAKNTANSRRALTGRHKKPTNKSNAHSSGSERSFKGHGGHKWSNQEEVIPMFD